MFCAVLFILRHFDYVALFCVILVFCLLVVLARLSVGLYIPVQVTDWKDSSLK